MRLYHALLLVLVSDVYACDEPPGPLHEAYAAIVREEDARGEQGLERIRSALASPDPVVRALAVRALGRMEDPGLMRDIAAHTGDGDPGVRSAAVLALGQAAFGQTGTEAITHLRQALTGEEDPTVLGALATAGGWVTPGDTGELEALTGLLVEIAGALPTPEADPGLAGLTGLARGVEALVRRNRPEGPASDVLAGLAEALTDTHSLSDPLEAGRIRSLATAALVGGNRLSAKVLAQAAEDGDFEVRRQAALAVTRYGTAYRTIIPPLLVDEEAHVRLAALGAYDRWLRPSQGCGLILERLEDTDPHVALRAADLLARPLS